MKVVRMLVVFHFNFYWNIDPTAKTPSSFWIVESSPNHPATNVSNFLLLLKKFAGASQSHAPGSCHEVIGIYAFNI